MIVDSFGSPTIKADLAAFDRQFGYPAPPKFTIIAPVGKIPAFNPGNSDMAGWAGETTLDVEYAHALAPGANILLVETPVSETEGVTGFPQIVRAEEYALAHYKVGVISQSFSATEETFKNYAQLDPLRAAYKDADSRHVTVLAASGDAGATDYQSDEVNYYPRRVTSWPDSDPLVTAVGGTQLRPHGTGYTSVAWNDTYDRGVDQVRRGLDRPGPDGQRRRHLRVLRPPVLPGRRQGRHRRAPGRAGHRDERGLRRLGEPSTAATSRARRAGR